MNARRSSLLEFYPPGNLKVGKESPVLRENWCDRLLFAPNEAVGLE